MSHAPGPGDRVVVVSPHLDDGVLSLGAAISSWSRSGVDVVLLTVLACDPHSGAPTGGWDERSGFASEGEAATARREEDRRACAVLGTTPEWLSFGSGDYERHGDDEAVYGAVSTLVNGAAVLLPGAPLTQPDHAWLVRVLVERGLSCARLGFYAEQPYRERSGRWPEAPGWLTTQLASVLAFETVGVSFADRFAKLRAVRRYESQLGPLALDRRGGWPLLRLVVDEARAGGEAVAWVPGER